MTEVANIDDSALVAGPLNAYDEAVPAFAERLRQVREEKGLSLAEAGDRAGMTRQNWHQYESGRRTNPSLSVMSVMARALGVSLQKLLADVDPVYPED